METKRVGWGKEYYFINTNFEVEFDYDYRASPDNLKFDNNNYFTAKEKAESMAHKLRAVLAGADVIEMPSEEEIVDAAEEHVEACDEEGYPYADDEDAKAAFRNGVAWLKSKIIK